MDHINHVKWPKTPRRGAITFDITEKIDGTNAYIFIDVSDDDTEQRNNCITTTSSDGGRWVVAAGSRNRMLTPGVSTDNYGFAGWVYAHPAELVELLGPGRHYGEWWGAGIARKYGQTQRNFSLFDRWRYGTATPYGTVGNAVVDTVPLLGVGEFSNDDLFEQEGNAMRRLILQGSQLDPSTRAEGIITTLRVDGQATMRWKTFHPDDPHATKGKTLATLAA